MWERFSWFILQIIFHDPRAFRFVGVLHPFKGKAVSFCYVIISFYFHGTRLYGNAMPLPHHRHLSLSIIAAMLIGHFSGITLSGTALSRIAFSGLALSEIALSRIALSGISLSGIALSKIALSGIALSGISLSGIALSGIALVRIALSGLPNSCVQAGPGSRGLALSPPHHYRRPPLHLTEESSEEDLTAVGRYGEDGPPPCPPPQFADSPQEELAGPTSIKVRILVKDSVADPRHFGVDPDPDSDPDPPIFVNVLQEANKKIIRKKVFLLITF